MSFITVAGENQIAIKQGNELTLGVTHFVLANITGLGAEPVDRIEPMPDGGDIVATLPVTDSGYVNGNQVVYSLVMDSTMGDFDFNWIGLKDDENVLIAVAYVPTISKTATAGNVPGNNMTRNFLIAFSGIAATTAISVPASTWQIDFNTRLWGIDERERRSNFDIYGQAAFLGSGWKVVRQGLTTTYDILPGIGYVGGIRVVNDSTEQVVAASPPKAVWLDVSLQGDISGVSAVVVIIVDNDSHSDFTDGMGFNHYLSKIANIEADGAVNDDEARPPEVNIHPVGSVVAMANAYVPAGFITCNGAEINRATYSDLFTIVGTTYGVGDGSLTFNLPDLRGEFLRGFDDGRGVDSGRAIGSEQLDAFEDHDHFSNMTVEVIAAGLSGTVSLSRIQANTNYSTSSTGGVETRPRNIAMMFCIKY